MKNVVLARIILPLALIAGSAAIAVGEPVVVQVPSLLAVEHPKNSATGIIHIHNPGKSVARVALRAEDFVSSAGKGKPLNATVTFSDPRGSAPSPVYEATLDAGALHAVKVEVANVWEAGESTAKILDGNREVAVLRAAKYRVPLAVRVVGAGDDPVVLTLENGRVGTLILRNDDPMTYQVEWRLTIDSEFATGTATLPPGSTTASRIETNTRWFSAPLEGVFKDELKPGTLALRLVPSSTVADPGTPEKVIPMRARLVYWPSPLRNPVSMALVFVALLAGGLCSLMLNQWLPNRLRRLDLEDRLGDIATRTHNVSFRVDSGLRIHVRVERYRLLRLLRSRYAFSPEMIRVLAECRQAADRLEAKVGLLERIDVVDDDVRHLRLVAPPTRLNIVDGLLEKAADRLRGSQPTDTDLQGASVIVMEAETKLNALRQPDADFVAKLIDRFKALHEDLGPGNPLRKDPKFGELTSRFPGLFEYLDRPAPDPALRADAYFDHDLTLLRLELLRDYLRLRSEQSEERRRLLEAKGEPDLLKHVGVATADAYREAILDLRALREGKFTKEVEDEILNKRIRIDAQPPDPRPHQAVELSAKFANQEFNRCGARYEYDCLWTFKHVDSDGRLSNWFERGWQVNHFFPRPDTYAVKVTFQNKDGIVVADETKPIEVVEKLLVGDDNARRFSDRTWIEAARFGVVLFATVLGLLGGARDHLMKLDVVAGLIAIFLIGFGADTVKNMLTERSAAPDPARK
jgi:hypothetical protein